MAGERQSNGRNRARPSGRFGTSAPFSKSAAYRSPRLLFVQVESQLADQESGGHAADLVALIVLIAAVLAAPALTSRYGFIAFTIVYAVAVVAWSVARSAPLKFGVIVALAIGLRVAML